MSPNIWAMAYCAISAGPRHMRMMPNAPPVPDCTSLKHWKKATAPNGEKLEARIGIATGLVVVGDLVGEGAAQEEAVIGETPNLAARMQGVANPGQIVVSDSTRRLLSNALDVGAYWSAGPEGHFRPRRRLCHSRRTRGLCCCRSQAQCCVLRRLSDAKQKLPC